MTRTSDGMWYGLPDRVRRPDRQHGLLARETIYCRGVMIDGVRPTLNYHTPPLDEPDVLERFINGGSGVYVIGLAIGAVALAIALSLMMRRDWDAELLLNSLLAWFASFAVTCACGLVAALIQRLRDRSSAASVALGQRLFGPLVTLLYYPPAHALMCKLGALITGDETYVTQVSGIHFVPIWLVCGSLLTAAMWKGAPLGARRLDWVLAGVAAPISIAAFLEGMHYMLMSVTGSVSPDVSAPFSVTTLVAGLLAVPAIVGLTFAPLRVNSNSLAAGTVRCTAPATPPHP